jgi:pyruvate dehydrogenase E2 component (dihydrolipoamide acetyltransferase)
MGHAVEVRVPDIGDFKDIPVIELLVKPGDVVGLQDSVATLESDKATLDVPSSAAGRVLTVDVTPGTRVSQGSLLLTLEGASSAESTPPMKTLPEIAQATPATRSPIPESNPKSTMPSAVVVIDSGIGQSAEDHVEKRAAPVYASPSIRRIGHELGVDLVEVKGSGRRGRILAEDVHQFVRARMAAPPANDRSTDGAIFPPAPPNDFAKFGEIERQTLARIRRISGRALARNWATIPQVTNFDVADVTEIEQFRGSINAESLQNPKVTLLSFLVKACAATLKAMPMFNASLDGEELIVKKYVNIGVAVDTPNGLLVPVLYGADSLGIRQIASTLSAKAALARAGKLKPADMEGGCFTISSLGGVGGTGFTPIINAPELAILGVGKANMEPRWDGEKFVPRLMVPLSLSWDHRALDGVAAARFLVQLVVYLEDLRRLAL